MDQKSKDAITAELTAEYRAAIKRTADEEQANRRRRGGPSKKSVRAAYAIWFALGTFGGHRFYLGRIGSGAIMGTLGLCGTVLAYTSVATPLPALSGMPGAGLLGLSTQGLVGLVFSAPVFVWWLIDAFLIPGMIPD